ncbi:MAG TPA: hypothetical protein VHH10_04125 [Rubrobacteraceae bacterium]|nr:hypothetical protein [Rubrobacteraceae bacterium]
MPEDDFYTPTDADMLRMENELLAFEVRFLKARLGRSGKDLGSSTPLSRISYLAEAEGDLVLLLRRLGGSPLGPVFRLQRNFRVLEDRYLNSPEPQGPPDSPYQIARLEGAETDLALLLRRLGRPPLGWLFRRRRSFRTLQERYLSGEHGESPNGQRAGR